MTFRAKLTELVRQKRLNIRQAAKDAGISYNTMRGYLTAKNNRSPSAQKGIALAHVLEVPAEWLFDDKQEWPPPPRYEPPPFHIYPYPPNGIDWDELQVAVATFAYQKCIDRLYELGGGFTLGRDPVRYIQANHFRDMNRSPSYLANLVRAMEARVREYALELEELEKREGKGGE